MKKYSIVVLLAIISMGNIKPVFSQITTFPYSEDFSSNTFGDWVDADGDDWHWSLESETTPTGGTGPTGGSNGGGATDYYAFVESSDSGSGQQRAYLELTFDFTGEFNPVLTFDYHMFGYDGGARGYAMGSLHIDVHDGEWTNNVFSLYGEQQFLTGDPWLQSVIDLSAYENRRDITIRFRGVTGPNKASELPSTNRWSDMSIDNISVCTINPGTATISEKMFCNTSSTVDLSLTGHGAGTIQWQESTDNITYTNISLATTADYTTSTLSSPGNHYFRAAVTNGCVNYSNVVSVVIASANGVVTGFPYLEDFETGTTVEWTNSTEDYFDWEHQQGSTTTNDTGASLAHSGTGYIVTDGSDPNNPYRIATIEHSFDFTLVVNPELSFWYHMFGEEIGILTVGVGADQNVYQLSGMQQASSSDDWRQATVDLSAYAGRCNVTISIEGLSGTDKGSDKGIDDIEVVDACDLNSGVASISDDVLCAAGSVSLSLVEQDGGATLNWQQSTDNVSFSNIGSTPKLTTGTLSTGTYYFRAEVTVGCTDYSNTVSVIVGSAGSINAFPYSEDFETDFGSWTNPTLTDDIDWIRDSGESANAPSTGPDDDNSAGGSYITINPSAGSAGDEALLETEVDFTGVSSPVMTFYYHMFGADMGNLYLIVNNDEQKWSALGEQQAATDDAWIQATVDLSAYANECNVNLQFRGVAGSDVTASDMAIDDIAICTVDGGSAAISDNAICSTGNVELSLASYSEGSTIQWQEAVDSPTFSDIVGATSEDYTYNVATTGDSYLFRAIVTNTCSAYSDTVSLDATSASGENTFPHFDDFEGTLGADVWRNRASASSGDDFQWINGSDATPTSNTGPSGANSGSDYLFTESSDPNNPNKVAYLDGDFDFSVVTDPKLTFYYHMYGLDMGSLYVDVNGVNVWSIKGQQQSSIGAAWEKVIVDLSDFAGECNALIRLRGVTGGFRSDMAIDDMAVCDAPATSVITGSTDVCKNDTGIAYSVTNNPGNTYTWIIDGGVQASGTNTSNITIDWGSIGKVGSIKVLERSGECVGDTVTLNVNIHTIETSAITGKTTVDANAQNVTYSVTGTNDYEYEWTIDGGTQAGGTNTESITVNWGAAGAGSVSVEATSTAPACLAAPSVNLPVTVYSKFISDVSLGFWNVPATWGGTIPPTTGNAQILFGHTVTLAQNETIDNLIIDAGATLNNDIYTLTVTGDYTNNGNHIGSGNIVLSGEDTDIDGTGTINTSGELQLTEGNKTILSTATLTKLGAGDININTTDIDITNNGSLIIEGSLNAIDPTVTWINGPNSSIEARGSILASGSIDVSAEGNTVTYNYSGDQDIKLPSGTRYQNLELGQSGVKSLTGNIVVQGNLIISGAARLDPSTNNYDIYVKGDWINTSSDANSFEERNSTVTFNNSTEDQTITNVNEEIFHNMEVNKSSGNVILANNIRVSNSLTLTKGLISPTTDERVTFASGATATSTLSSYVNGIVAKEGVDAFTFPVGKNANRGQISISAPSTTTTFTAEYFDERHVEFASLTAPLNHISPSEYWLLDRESGTGSASVTLHWDSGTRSNILDVSSDQLRVAHFNGTNWISEGGTVTGITSEGSVTSNIMSSFSPIALGDESTSSLPVELTSFNANLRDHQVELSWATASESNNDYFEVQNSLDGKQFETIGTIDGAGNSKAQKEYTFIDRNPHLGVVYYRLKQVDYDGKFEVFDAVVVNNEIFDSGIEVLIYPNPTHSSDIRMRFKSAYYDSTISVDMFDLMGKLVYRGRFASVLGTADYQIQLQGKIENGIYNLIIRQGNNQKTQKLAIK